MCCAVINPCASKPCLNGASCTVSSDTTSYKCNCNAAGFAGIHCEIGNLSAKSMNSIKYFTYALFMYYLYTSLAAKFCQA